MSRPLIALVAVLVLVGAVAGGFVAEARSTSSGSSATCAKWDVSGVWNGHQSNDVRGTLRFTFKQSGTGGLTGNASFSRGSGHLTGSVKGSKVDFIVSWTDGHRGHYFGTVSARSISGNGFDVTDPSTTATWSATGTAVCKAKTKKPPALPKPDPDDATARMMDIKPARGGVTVIRGGKTYSASENSQLQTGDILKTDGNTMVLFEFLNGGRVQVSSGVEVKMINDRAANDAHALTFSQKLGKVGAGIVVRLTPQDRIGEAAPMEIQHGGSSVVGIRG